MTRSVPGLLMRSVYPDTGGQPIFSAGRFATTDQSPLSERWGGWYVTGNCGRQHHMGNVLCNDEEHPEQSNFSKRANLSSLSALVETSAYLRDSSDAVALLVLTHQQHLHNLLTAANYEVRRAVRHCEALNQALGDPPSHRAETTLSRIRSACEPVVRAMLFSGEVALEDPIRGTSGFGAEFSARGPFDHRGRSLRDLDLTRRLFKYPCSYLIYSEQFEALPADAKKFIYHRLWEVLTGRDDTHPFDHLRDADCDAIRQILAETKTDLPKYWRSKAAS